ncbi:MAG: RHH-type transcriptional regulator, proline utilization regulon repressor / proline dehydrogenase [Actinomycetota bacterium]|jgi:RHH-type proline utilization regulon transcriptional repressor/proline dehydrogenase/delta 1-pyrroline-5-carboxylate dehydrogenase|nr:RHH-type transcriptional regulator, proline utilization regulon repressor / proline dehydrogenase [Actinomycetota bacterium]
MGSSLDPAATAVARQLADLAGKQRSGLVESSWWTERMLEWAMSHPSFKTQLFRFVDVFPSTSGDADVLRHLEEYFEGADVPKALDLGLDLADHVPFGKAAAATIARHNITRVAQQFIVGSGPDEAVEGLHRLWRQGSAFTVDLLGEKTVTEAEADLYAERVGELLAALIEATPRWAPDDHLERDDLGPLPRVNVSLKPTALSSRYSPLTAADGLEQAKSRLRPILRQAQAGGAFIHFDAEHYDVKDLTLQLARELLSEPEFAEMEAGVVIQAYLKDARRDLAEMIDLSASRPRPLTVRLVKGAYWDTETVHARAEGWPVPVFARKEETDASFERCVAMLHDHHGQVRAAFGSHNLRSLGYAVAYARDRGIPDSGYEVQLLYGMAAPLHAAVRRMGLRLRVYAPVGELVPGMAYLVRRLLENTANESFVRRRFVEGRDLDELLAPPGVDVLPEPEPPVRRRPTDPAHPGPYSPEPVAEWRRDEVRTSFGSVVALVDKEAVGRRVPAVVDGRPLMTDGVIRSVDPADPDRTVAVSASASRDEAESALAAARRAWPAWRRTPARDRAAVLFRAAEWMRARRPDLAALEVLEAGKPWADADADVCEAIDFCEYYGREMIRLDRGGTVESPPGERNRLTYAGRGIGVVIAPWNFPLAIPTGMVTAALVSGNAVLFKPAEQTPAVAAKLVDALVAGGLPPGVLAFLPGVGEDIGAYLVEHPDVSFITFTGSKDVGLRIIETAAKHRPGQRHVKRVVAEMGGKNAIVVDADADLDQAVPIAVASAFGYAGQKCSACSRLVVVDSVYDQVVERVAGAARELRVGHPRDMATSIGPLIDADAYKRVRSYVELAPTEGRVVLDRSEDVPAEGWFVGPTVVADVKPGSRLATEEIFGPVLSIMRAGDFDDAIAIANDTEYALTAGVVSRSPAHIRQAVDELRAGNVYVNRTITGAVVGRHPFGGHGLSGVGSKAGGPDYLLQFLEPRAVSENTLRQGFAPDAEESAADESPANGGGAPR